MVPISLLCQNKFYIVICSITYFTLTACSDIFTVPSLFYNAVVFCRIPVVPLASPGQLRPLIKDEFCSIIEPNN